MVDPRSSSSGDAPQWTIGMSPGGHVAFNIGREIAKALAAGARAWRPAADHGFMYVVSFQDPDGHVWEVAWMDPAAAQQG